MRRYQAKPDNKIKALGGLSMRAPLYACLFVSLVLGGQ
jgi:hypothetical protein